MPFNPANADSELIVSTRMVSGLKKPTSRNRKNLKQPKLTPKAIRERRRTTTTTKKPKVSRRKEILKIRSEINEKHMKETTAKINKTKSLFFEQIN